jgi:hypothetical protein
MIIGSGLFWSAFFGHPATAVQGVPAGFAATETAIHAIQRFLLSSACQTLLGRRYILTLAISFVAQCVAAGVKDQYYM